VELSALGERAQALPLPTAMENRWSLWLARRVVDRLNSMRRPHESLSDVILALAAGQ
jgi:hypothetical protein